MWTVLVSLGKQYVDEERTHTHTDPPRLILRTCVHLYAQEVERKEVETVSIA